uniref:Death-inducer obliterator 1 n=1 Tax=Callorhinchus milii TaxID=7868 RepID=A0A4W3IP31_CALMI
MLSDKDPLLPSSSTPFRLELQTEASETPDLKLDDVGANISATAENENAELSGLQESSQNSNNSESNVANSNRKSPRLHSVAANNKDHNKAEPSRIIHPSSKEFKKTWGFRQTTIAKRESALDAEASDTLLNENSDQQAQLTLRRSRRQTQRTARVQEFISAAQKRYRRTSGFDEGGEFLSIASEVEAGSDGSIDAVEEKGPDSIIDLGSDSLVEEINEESISDKGSSTNSDSDELTLKELQNQLRKRRVQERCDSPQTTQLVQEISSEENQSKKGTKLAGIVKPKKLLSTSVKKGSKSSAVPKDSEQLVKKELKLRTSIKSETEEDESSVSQSDNDYNDPDKLYCICRQPHNNRFMICCDRCEEWFHGDCVGITMARGRLLERNGEDYICPDCSPSPDKGSSSTEMTSGQQESKSALASTGDQNAALEKPDGSSPTDQGIKGRIEKAANPSGKKKIKIFKPINSKQLPSGPRKAIEGTDTNETSSKKLVVLVHNRPVAIPKESAAGPALGTWTIDHNYNAVKPEKTVISTSVFYKSLQKEGDTNVDSLSAGERSTGERHILPKPPPTSQQASKPPTPANKQLGSKRPITTTQQSPSSKQPSSTKQLSTKQPGPANKQLTSATPSGKKSADRQSVQLSAPGAKPSSQPSNSQIRHNIRRSLKEILCKRVNDCDDLDVTEEVIGKIAVNIEKELFMLFRETDSKYKSRYRCIMFNLKNPRNQGLFRRVLQEQIVPSRLVRMSPEEIESKELAMWGEKESRSAREQSARLQRETKRPASRVMNKSEVDLEEAPPMSDADEQEDSRPAQKNSAPLPDILSLMLKDTTDEHRAHLFDLNCRICTGKIQVSDDEPVPKKPKVVVTKKTEPKPKPREEWRHRPELDKPAVTVSAAQVTAVSTQVTSSLCIASVASFSISKDTSQISSVFVTSSPAAPASSECATAVINTAPINTTSKLSPSTHPEIKSAVPQYSSAVPAAAKGVKLTDEEKKPEALKSILTTATPKSILSKPSAASEKTCTMSSAIRLVNVCAKLSQQQYAVLKKISLLDHL